jgi:hypothetical protein
MVQRATPEQLGFGMVIDENTWILVGIIIVGIVACVACVTIASMKRG